MSVSSYQESSVSIYVPCIKTGEIKRKNRAVRAFFVKTNHFYFTFNILYFLLDTLYIVANKYFYCPYIMIIIIIIVVVTLESYETSFVRSSFIFTRTKNCVILVHICNEPSLTACALQQCLFSKQHFSGELISRQADYQYLAV